MGVPVVAPIPSLADRISSLLDRVDYRLADNDEEKEAVFRLRYEAYLREGTIVPAFGRRVSDVFDESDNAWTFGIYIDDQLASSIRIHVATRRSPNIPANQVFGDLIEPEIAAGRTIIDPTRFVTDFEIGRRIPEIPFLTVRVAHMASEFFGADIVLATVRAEHRAFYRRVFGHKPAAEPRPYPSLTKPISLMTLDYPAERQSILRRYPFFRSTYFERRMLFDPASRIARRSARIIPLPVLEGLETPALAS